MKASQFITLSVASLCIAGGAALAGGAGDAQVPLTRGGKSACVIVYPRDCALSSRTAAELADYLHEHTGTHVPAVAEDQFTPAKPGTTLVILDGTADHRLAQRLGVPVRMSARHPDAYQLKVMTPSADTPRLVLAGRGPSGVKYAAYRLRRELEIVGRDAGIRRLDVSAEPFFKTRSVSLFNVWNMSIELTRRHNTESWDAADLERYVDLFDAYGFNAIESHDRFDDGYMEPLFGLKRETWRAKVLRMCDRAHANGQEFFLRIWGHVVMDTPARDTPRGPNDAVSRRVAYLCVNDPAGRVRWEREIRDYYVKHYAGRIDHLIGHWCDPGVCRENGCDFKTTLTLQSELHRAFKAVDPKFKSTFSLWYFDRILGNPAPWARNGWAGYTSDNDLIGTGILDKDVLIATYTTEPGPYKPEVVQSIVDHGHRPALWTWYRADHETRPSLHIHVDKLLSEYFKSLPESARQLEWHNVERNVHGAANTANYYVAGRLMWDPSLHPEELLREFATLTFGRENGERVLPAYLAIAKIRCHSCQAGAAALTGVGTAHPETDLNVAEDALRELSEVKTPSAFRPRIPLDITPEQLVIDLKASLEVIRDYARLRATVIPAIQKAVAARDRDTVQRLQAEVQAKYGVWNQTISGRQEWVLIDRLFKAQQKEVESGLPAGTAAKRKRT